LHHAAVGIASAKAVRCNDGALATVARALFYQSPAKIHSVARSKGAPSGNSPRGLIDLKIGGLKTPIGVTGDSQVKIQKIQNKIFRNDRNSRENP
jgi:hypothetical protein